VEGQPDTAAFMCAWMSQRPDSNLIVAVTYREKLRHHGNNQR
jgi:hypothetical protein